VKCLCISLFITTMKYHGLLRATPRDVLNGKPKNIYIYIYIYIYILFCFSMLVLHVLKEVLNKISKCLFSSKNTIFMYL